MDSFKTSVEVKAVTITDNAVETITTAEDSSGNAYTISSDNLKEIASEAASWLSSHDWSDVATLMESSHTDRDNFVAMVQTTASNYWELVQ